MTEIIKKAIEKIDNESEKLDVNAKKIASHIIDTYIVLLSNMLGHSDINTTAIYLQRTEQEQIRELNKTVNW